MDRVARLPRPDRGRGDQRRADPRSRSSRSTGGSTATTRAIEDLSQSWASSFERSSKANQEHLARTLHSLKDALDLLNVSMEQGNALYRSIVKRTFSTYPVVSQDSDAA